MEGKLLHCSLLEKQATSVEEWKGDDMQKLSVIQALPQLLQFDPNATITRILPKIQQELPKSSCEFHVATSKIFKLLIEKQLPLNLTGAVIQGTESKDPVVSNAWIETLLAVIPILPIEQVKIAVIPLALSKSQPSSPVYCRVASCKIFGKCAAHPKMQNIDVKSSILPAVQSLCQDSFQDVRAVMCSQLHLVAQGLGENLVKTNLLPSLVELATDDNIAVRSAAIGSAVLIIPFLNKETKSDTIIPLIKQLCSKTGGAGDATFPTIAREFGKLLEGLQNDLNSSDSVWILQFFKTLSTKGQTVKLNKDNVEVTQDVLCREQCANNLPSVTAFTIARVPNQLELWHGIFSALANDSCYLVRKTTAACLDQVARILGDQCKIIKDDIIQLLRDDAEEVLHMLVPHVGFTLQLLCNSNVLSKEQNQPSALEIMRALLKCQAELSKGYNWRIRTAYLQQLQQLPHCMPSDFIHQHFTPVILNCAVESRPKPVRSEASRTVLIFLRYNLKEIQRKWIRDNLVTNLCYAKSCYTRLIYTLACEHAAELFSNTYFKKHFLEPLLSLTEDPICNVRLCVAKILPVIYKMLNTPEDKKFQTRIDNIFSKFDMTEKDKDVIDTLKAKLKVIRNAGPPNKQDIADQKKKEEEENKVAQGKFPASPTLGKTPPTLRDKESIGINRPVNIIRPTSAPSRVYKSTSNQQPASDMSFLEQHFYIDAGINLPCDNLDRRKNYDQDKVKVSEIDNSDSLAVATVSVENVNIETLTEFEIKKLEISTTNLTDDIKVNMRKRNKQTVNKTCSHENVKCSDELRFKRFSSVYPRSQHVNREGLQVNLNRRSLNMGGGDRSKIPIMKKKNGYSEPSSTSFVSNGNLPSFGGDAKIIVNEIPKMSGIPSLKWKIASETKNK